MKEEKNLKEVLPAQQEGAELQKQEEQVSENSEVSQMLRYLAPWVEKTNGEESVGSWETTMATQMMVKLLYLWLTEQSRKKVAKMLKCYHPLDRAAMAYALLVYMMTGRQMTFRSAMAQHHFMTISKVLKEDMPELMFADHMKYMMSKYGPNEARDKQ